MALSEAVKLEREKRKSAREERNWIFLNEKVLTPSNVRLLAMMAIIAYSTHVTRSKENVGPVQSALAFALPGIGIPLIAADAGIRDKWALGAISAAGVGYVTGQMLVGWGEAGLLPTPASIAETLLDIPESIWDKLKDILPGV